MNRYHIWLGRFTSDASAAYFEEQYGNDDAPLSQFCAEQGEKSYDHDFVELSVEPEPQSIKSLVDGHSSSEAYLDLVVTKATELEIVEANVFVLANTDEFEHPQSASGPGYQLWYLGEYECIE